MVRRFPTTAVGDPQFFSLPGPLTRESDISVRRLWVKANLLRIETFLMVAYVGIGATIPDIPGSSPWLPIFSLVTGSFLWFVFKMISNWLTVLILIALAMIPLLGWLVLAALVILRIGWFAHNSFAAVASLLLALLPLTARAIPLEAWQSATILVLVSTVILLSVYSRGYSALSMLDVFLTLPTAIITLVASAAHMISHASASENSASIKQPAAKPMENVQQGSDPADPHLEFVKMHVRTSPDGIEQNNLSYSGPDKIPSAANKVDVSSYVRTEADGVIENNLSFTGKTSSGITVNPLPNSPEYSQVPANDVTTSWELGSMLSAIAPAMVGSIPRPRSYSPRFAQALDGFLQGQRRAPRRLRVMSRQTLTDLDRKIFWGSLLQSGTSQWQRFKNFLADDGDYPDRMSEAWRRVNVVLIHNARAQRDAQPLSFPARALNSIQVMISYLLSAYGIAMIFLGWSAIVTQHNESRAAMVLGGNQANSTVASLVDLFGLNWLILKEDSWMEWEMTTVWIAGAVICCSSGFALSGLAALIRKRLSARPYN